MYETADRQMVRFEVHVFELDRSGKKSGEASQMRGSRDVSKDKNAMIVQIRGWFRE